MMKIIVGLGNPGEKYKKTRHNVGFMVVDKLNSKLKTQNANLQLKTKSYSFAKVFLLADTILAKPLTFMNRSGEAIAKLLQKVRPTPKYRGKRPRSFRAFVSGSDLYIIHDDLDIPLGKYKIQFGKGPRVHKGVESVEKALGTKDFWRVRVGIENRKDTLSNGQIGFAKAKFPLGSKLSKETKRISGEAYVLQEFTKEEKKIIDQVILEVIEEIKNLILAF